jgi:hypothetical protein
MAVKRKSTGVFGIVVSFDWAGRNVSSRQPGRHKFAKVLPRYSKRTMKQVAEGAKAPRERMRGRVGLGGAPISRKSGAPHTITASI